MDIKNKIVIVTGAGKGIGLALAQRFRNEDAKAIICCDVDKKSVEDVAEKVGGIPMVCDVSNAEQVEQVIRDTENRFGRVDIYCANAGIMERGGVEIPNKTFQRSLDINVMSHLYAARACLPGMIRQKSGYFLFTVSAAGLLTQLGAVAYSVSKHAAVGFSEWLAINHGHQGIKVSMLCPQAVDTSMIDSVEEGGIAGKDGILTPEQVAGDAINAIRSEKFLVLPHGKVEKYIQYKAGNYDEWIGSMQQLRDWYPNG